MNVMFDTSVLVAAVVQAHPMHERAVVWLRRAKSGELGFFVPAHALAELYAVLTRLPTRPRINSAVARRLIHQNVESAAKIVSLSTADYRKVLDRAAELGFFGGAVYDGLIARAAEKAGVDRLLTFNPNDFRRVWPEGRSLLVVP